MAPGAQATSSMMARTQGATVVVHPDEGVVSWLLKDGSIDEFQTDGRPTRIALQAMLRSSRCAARLRFSFFDAI